MIKFKHQVTITEKNGYKHETWSYILYLTEDEYQYLKQFVENEENKIIFERSETRFYIKLSNYTKEEVELINNHSDNGYKDRINFYEILNINILDISISPDDNKNDFVKIFYKAKGLKQI